MYMCVFMHICTHAKAQILGVWGGGFWEAVSHFLIVPNGEQIRANILKCLL